RGPDARPKPTLHFTGDRKWNRPARLRSTVGATRRCSQIPRLRHDFQRKISLGHGCVSRMVAEADGCGPELEGRFCRARHVTTRESDDRDISRQYWTAVGSTEWLAVQYEYTRRR